MTMRWAVIQLPGSNCDQDVFHVLKNVLAQEVDYVWHKDSSLNGADAVVLPGGFSYGDYLRCGAIARFSPIMPAVKYAAAAGKTVLGICNGFQILCEAGLLPGALMRNAGLKYICKQLWIRTETTDSAFTHGLQPGQVLQVPIGHMEGNYFCDDRTLAELQHQDRVAFRYSNQRGDIIAEANPNGSLDNIAGVLNEGRNVLGMMPHPDRSSEKLLGSSDGFQIFHSLVGALSRK